MGRTRGRKKGLIARTPVIPELTNTIRPGNDFYMHVNKKWLTTTSLPSYESSYGVSEEIEDQIRTKLLGLIRGLKEGAGQHEEAVRIFFKAGLHSNFHRDHMKTFMQQFGALQCLRSAEDYAKQLADFVNAGIPTFLTIGLGRDLEAPEVNVLTISPGYLSLPDPSYYKGDAPGKMETLAGFETLMRRFSHELSIEGLERIVSLESHVADIYDTAKDDEPFMATCAQLKSKYPSIPWPIFWNNLGFTKCQSSTRYLVQSNTWLKWLNRHFRIAPAADWILWFRVQLLLYFAPLLPAPIDQLFFNYFGRRLRGDREKMTMENLLYYLAQGLMMPSLSVIYSKCCLSEAHVRSARDFAGRIRASAEKRIAENDWLSEGAKRRSRLKVAKMDLDVAVADTGLHYQLPELSETDIVFNVIALGRAAMARNIFYAAHPALDLPVMDPVFEVNAHYYTSGNRLVIPGGITFWPFYDSSAGRHLGWSYGGLGVVVGHEMLHGFDEDGSRYNEDGVYRPWWSRADLAAYARRTKALIRLFSSTRFMGRFLSGKSTLSENIADLGGMAIALDALKREMGERHLDEQQKKKELRDFFISYAVSWRTKERRQRSLYRLFTDSHAPAEVRVNRIVGHFQDWYDTFNVKPTDALYIDNKDRIAIF